MRRVREHLDLAPGCRLSYREIAELLGIEEPVVVGTAYRLRDELAAEGIESWHEGLQLRPQDA